MFLGIVFVIAAGYSLIVAMSYFSHIGNDQSALLNGDFDPDMIKNAGGPLGAWLAHTLIYKWLGIGSFILIYYIAMCGISMLKVYRPPVLVFDIAMPSDSSRFIRDLRICHI